MERDGSYKIKNFAANVEQEIRRLKAQVELFWEKEARLLRGFGLRDGMKVLECGCGPGHVLEKLLATFPGCDVTGVEIDPFLVLKSRAAVSALGKGRGHVYERSITDLGFPDSSFDFVISRLVLEHLPEPARAVKEVHRVLKTGGKAVFIDNDFDMHLRAYPDIPELRELYDAYCRCRTAEGGNPRIGRELPGLLMEAGFSKIDLEIVSAHSTVVGDEVFLRSEGSGIPAQLVKDGYLARDVMDRLARKWHAALHEKHHVFFRQLFVAAGERQNVHASHARLQPLQMGRSKRSPAVQAVHGADSRQARLRLLTTYVQVQLAASLRTEAGRIPLDTRLIDLGLDSLMSVELANRFAGDFGAAVSAMDVLDCQSVHAAARLLEEEIERLKLQAPAGPAAEEGGPASAEGGLPVMPGQDHNGWEAGVI
jgi:SAM-dependent methyltransferase/acyl carrier protein